MVRLGWLGPQDEEHPPDGARPKKHHQGDRFMSTKMLETYVRTTTFN